MSGIDLLRGDRSDVRRSCVVLAVWFKEGIVESDARFLFDCCSSSSAYFVRTLQPSWFIAVFPDDFATKRFVADAITGALAAYNQKKLSSDIRVGVQLGNVVMSLDKNGKSTTQPVGSPMSGAMKRATEASYEVPCIGLNELSE